MATTTTRKPVTDYTEDYRHPQAMVGDHSLRYFRRKNGTHTVALHYPAGEQDFPDCWNYKTVEEARAQFVALRRHLASVGYARQ